MTRLPELTARIQALQAELVAESQRKVHRPVAAIRRDLDAHTTAMNKAQRVFIDRLSKGGGFDGDGAVWVNAFSAKILQLESELKAAKRAL